MLNKRLSPFVTVITLLLAAVMFWCSHWQWQRYKAKVELVKTYELNRGADAVPFPEAGRSKEDFKSLLNRRVSISGSWDYDHQLIVINQRHVSGPGHHLFAPLLIAGSKACVMVNRGFIPFSDWSAESLRKYDFDTKENFDAVIKESVSSLPFGPENPETGAGKPWKHKWFFPEIEKMAGQIPCPVITSIYLEKIGRPGPTGFPAPDVRVEIPPQTHFGYTIEWFMLGIVTLAAGFIFQLFQRSR